MRTFALAFILLSTAASAFTIPIVPDNKFFGLTSSTSVSASKAATKAAKRASWFEGRGGASKPDGSSDTLPPCTIVGGGRIGDLLIGSSPDNVLVGRSDDMASLPAGPIYVCTRNDALDDVVERTPEDRRGDLVFLQNGYIEGWLEVSCAKSTSVFVRPRRLTPRLPQSKGLKDNTQILLFLAVTAKGADPIDGVTTANPEGLTAATGRHAEDFMSRLASLDLKCKVLDKAEYDRAMYEKMFWICTMMLVGAAKGCGTVGEAGERMRFG